MKHPRVFIRSPQLADAQKLAALARASRSFHRGWVQPPTTASAVRRSICKFDTQRHGRFLICRHEDAQIVGSININEIIRGPAQSAFLGYFVWAEFAGRGYMTEGLRLVLRHAFTHLRLHRLEANIQPDNAPSLALVRRCGFRREGYSPRYLKIDGRWRDHERWAILAEEWRMGAPAPPGRRKSR